MRDLTPPATSHETLLGDILHDEVDGLEPCNCLSSILDAARRRHRWLTALIGILAALTITVGLLLLAAGHRQPEPTSTIPTRLLEA